MRTRGLTSRARRAVVGLVIVLASALCASTANAAKADHPRLVDKSEKPVRRGPPAHAKAKGAKGDPRCERFKTASRDKTKRPQGKAPAASKPKPAARPPQSAPPRKTPPVAKAGKAASNAKDAEPTRVVVLELEPVQNQKTN